MRRQLHGMIRKQQLESKGKQVVASTRSPASASRRSIGPAPVVRPKLRIKRTTRFFVNILTSLNVRQKKAVKDLGFGMLLDYNLESVPGTLAYWVLETFDRISCSMILPSGNKIRIEDKDVELVFGFPRGDIHFDRCDRTAGLDFLETIDGLETDDSSTMKTKTVETLMLNEKDGGSCFKQLFLILMETALIETSPCGYVKPRIVNALHDLSRIKKLNWCGYLISNLIRTHGLWERNKSKVFSGPIVFLVAFYVDRVIHCKRNVPRVIPSIKGWTAERLKARQDAEAKAADYGLGYVSGQYDEDELSSTNKNSRVPQTEVDAASSSSVEKTYMRGVWSIAKYLGDGLMKLAAELQHAPPQMKKVELNHLPLQTTKLPRGWKQSVLY